ncbi:hypothetical protein ACIA8E_32505 [Streptomyces sp. NPDC051664]
MPDRTVLVGPRGFAEVVTVKALGLVLGGQAAARWDMTLKEGRPSDR